ncbi:MAG: hypothetical protein HOI95_08210 [Chromatiales bacterium]|nr:hypothetical protein [Chromatiales bacterium]
MRVGIPDDYNETILERTLAQFSRQYSRVEVFVRSGCNREFPEAIARNELDLTLYSAGEINTADIFYTEATVWAASTNFVLAEDEPVPLAQFDRDCRWRDVAADALDAIGRPWRTEYSSENYSSVKAAIGAGLAIGPLAASALGESMRVLDPSDGFPQLPSTTLRLLKNSRASSAIVQAMEKAIRAAIR